MGALAAVDGWPVAHVAAAAVAPGGAVERRGDTARRFRLASISKMFLGWITLIAVEEGTVDLDEPLGAVPFAAAPRGAVDIGSGTLRHLLAHAAGFAFEGTDTLVPLGTRRIYSNTGIEIAAQVLERAAGMSTVDYLTSGLLEPLGMTSTTLEGSIATGVHSTVDDLLRFVNELRAPRLISTSSAATFATVQFPGLPGVVPGIGSFADCTWGLGAEIRGTKQPHWTGRRNGVTTFGHFGGAGTLLWVDPEADGALIALTDRPFDEWTAEARRLWPRLSDGLLDEWVASSRTASTVRAPW